jgi:hypothetical protein
MKIGDCSVISKRGNKMNYEENRSAEKQSK